MNCIVLVKQVPDISNIPDNAWDKETGTLKRGVLDNVLNPLDLQAVTFAQRIKSMKPAGKTVYLTMGPPQARETLIECQARSEGEAVLLTDRAFAGADTAATAYSLALAIRRIEKEMFNGDRNYVIVSGMQSVDGDTAQVPPQIAEDLDIEQIAYAQGLEPGPGLTVKRIGPAGAETIKALSFPVLVTVTDCLAPAYRSFSLDRKARSEKVNEWSAASVGAETERIGLKGSHTQVNRIFSPSQAGGRACRMAQNAEELVAALKEQFSRGPAKSTGPVEEPYKLGDRKPSYKGEVWVYIERENGEVKPVSYELLAKARELADGLGEKVGAVVVSDSPIGVLADDLIASGADRVYSLEHPLLASFLPIPYKKAIGALLLAHKPQIMLFGATPLGRELGPRVAYSTHSGLTADCTKLEISDIDSANLQLVGVLKQTRPALGGNIMATILTRNSSTQMATVRPGVLKAAAKDLGRKGEIVRSTPDLGPADVRTEIISVEAMISTSPIRDADILVSGGRGFKSKGDFERYLAPLAAACRKFFGASTEISGTRMVVEDGYIPQDRQVGQTGQTVQPKIYFALGISGAVQQISGMQNSGIIVAVNKDPKARIFNASDLGIVGDVEAIVPEITKLMEAGS